MTVLEIRAADARRKSAWLAGGGEHPHGRSAGRHLLPRYLTSDTRDSVAWEYSEWGESAGMTP